MKKELLFACLFACSMAVAVAVSAGPVRAVSFLTPSIGKVGSTPKTPVSTQPSVKLGFTLKPRQFTVTAKNFKTVQYTIEYVKAGGVTEGLSGGGKAKSGTFVGRHYAGIQSTKYFIPHDVKSGKLTFTGKTLKGTDYTYNTSFVVKSGRLTLTK